MRLRDREMLASLGLLPGNCKLAGTYLSDHIWSGCDLDRDLDL